MDTQHTVDSQGRRPRHRRLGLAKARNRSSKTIRVWNMFVVLLGYVLHTQGNVKGVKCKLFYVNVLPAYMPVWHMCTWYNVELVRKSIS